MTHCSRSAAGRIQKDALHIWEWQAVRIYLQEVLALHQHWACAPESGIIFQAFEPLSIPIQTHDLPFVAHQRCKSKICIQRSFLSCFAWVNLAMKRNKSCLQALLSIFYPCHTQIPKIWSWHIPKDINGAEHFGGTDAQDWAIWPKISPFRGACVLKVRCFLAILWSGDNKHFPQAGKTTMARSSWPV